MSYDTLTDNQKAGLDFNAVHNNLTLDEYLDRLMANDGDRGFRELTSLNLAGITTKLAAEPSIIADIEAVVDAQVSVIKLNREAVSMERELEGLTGEVVDTVEPPMSNDEE
jgi:hypothetical protein